MEIREARPSDWEAIEALVRSAWRDEHIGAPEVYFGIEGVEGKLQELREELFEASGSRFVLALEGGRALGAILVRLLEPGRAWIAGVFLAPGPAAEGAGPELVRAAVPPDAEAGCELNRRDEATRRLLDALGFERVLESVVLVRRQRPA